MEGGGDGELPSRLNSRVVSGRSPPFLLKDRAAVKETRASPSGGLKAELQADRQMSDFLSAPPTRWLSRKANSVPKMCLFATAASKEGERQRHHSGQEKA